METTPRNKGFCLSVQQALLLTGGALLSFGLFIFSCYRIAWERPVPIEAVAAIHLAHRPRHLDAVISRLAPEHRAALESAMHISDAPTIFAVPVPDGGLEWHSLEAMADPPLRGRLRLLPREFDAYGFIREDEETRPLKISLESGRFRIVVGHEERGLKLPGDTNAKLRLLPLAESAEWYFHGDSRELSGLWSTLASSQLHFAQIAGLLASSTGTVELAVGAAHAPVEETPFVIRLENAEQARSLEDFDGILIDLVAELNPVEVPIPLADGSLSVEKRRVREVVWRETKELTYGTVHTYVSAAGKSKIVLFFEKDGPVWIASDISMIQAALMHGVEAVSTSEDACQPQFGHIGFVHDSTISNRLPFMVAPYVESASSIRKTTFRIDTHESGLFTICGYY